LYYLQLFTYYYIYSPCGYKYWKIITELLPIKLVSQEEYVKVLIYFNFEVEINTLLILKNK
jgi:hypothetical protein